MVHSLLFKLLSLINKDEEIEVEFGDLISEI